MSQLLISVDCLFQVGAASDLEQYIHRLGRTGRAGKTGEGLLILAPWEDYFLKKLESTKVSITPMPSPKITSQGNTKVSPHLLPSLWVAVLVCSILFLSHYAGIYYIHVHSFNLEKKCYKSALDLLYLYTDHCSL